MSLLDWFRTDPKREMFDLIRTEKAAAGAANRKALESVPADFYRKTEVTVTVHLCGPGRFAEELARRGAAPKSMAGFLEHGGGDHLWVQGGPAYGEMYLPQRDLGHELGHALYYAWGLPSSRMDHLYE